MMQLLMLGLDLLNQRTEYLRMLKKVFYVSKSNIRGPRRPSDYFLIEFFFRNAQECNNANIGIRGFISGKQTISVTKCYPSEY